MLLLAGIDEHEDLWMKSLAFNFAIMSEIMTENMYPFIVQYDLISIYEAAKKIQPESFRTLNHNLILAKVVFKTI